MSKWVRVVGTAALFLLSVSVAPGDAQHGQGGDKGRPQGKQQGSDAKQGGGDKQHATPRQQERPQGSGAAATGAQAERRGHQSAPSSQAQPASHGGDRAVARPRDAGQPVTSGSRRPLPPRPGPVAGKAEPRSAVRYPSEARSARSVREWQQQRGWQRQGGWGEHGSWNAHRAVKWEHDHRTWKQRGGYGGHFIPMTHFSLYFGPAHFFRIRTRPVIVMGYPRFYYRGYWFMMVDPWPEFWADDWYAGDDVYVDYDDGYYLHNRRHPGVSIAISVVL